MQSKILDELRASAENLRDCIFGRITLDRTTQSVKINIITNVAFVPSDKDAAFAVLRRYVPQLFGLSVEISKLAPDCAMVSKKIYETVCTEYKSVSATLSRDDISVEKTDRGFNYTIAVAAPLVSDGICRKVDESLKNCYCGEFSGKCVASRLKLSEIEIEERPEEIEFESPVRKFEIADFDYLEGDKRRDTAIYISDLNFPAEEVVVCGIIEDMRERKYVNKNGVEKSLLSITLNDMTASMHCTYFFRQKSAEKIRALKAGDSIVCTGSNEEYKGNLRFTVKTIDKGGVPKGFVPEKRQSKPAPVTYRFVSPQKFSDAEQTDIFVNRTVPKCLKGKTFVVLDLETTGLNCIPASGNMDRIIEIGAYKIVDGEITESFSTFVNPERKLSDEIIALTGITEEMVASAPAYADVMPDFFRFCYGSVLVGHNIVGFDYKFIDYYWSRLGYIFDRKLIDTIQLSQELLFLPNYKLNTIAEKFDITFNHHRAVDDALATAKIFIQLLRIKQSLPNYQ